MKIKTGNWIVWYKNTWGNENQMKFSNCSKSLIYEVMGEKRFTIINIFKDLRPNNQIANIKKKGGDPNKLTGCKKTKYQNKQMI